MVNGLLPHAIYRLGQSAVVLANSCLACLLCLGSLTHFLSAPHVLSGEPMILPFGEKFDLLISFEFQVILFQAPSVLNDKFFNGMSHLRQVLKRPCGPPMEMVAGSTAVVAFEPAGPSSPRPAPPNPGQLVKVLLQDVYGSMFVGVEVVRSMTHHGVSFEGAWLGAERPEVHLQGERRLHWPPGRNVPWVRVHLCTVDPDPCAAEEDLHIQRKDMKILNGPEELPDGEARLSASDWLREWQEGVATVPESGRLYDEEAARASSAGPFVLPPARGGTEGTEVGQRLAVLESQILRDLEGGDQRGVKRTTSGVKRLTLPAVPTPLLPEPGEEVVQQSREIVAPTPEGRKSLLRVRLETV